MINKSVITEFKCFNFSIIKNNDIIKLIFEKTFFFYISGSMNKSFFRVRVSFLNQCYFYMRTGFQSDTKMFHLD